MFSKKATKIDEIFTVDLTLYVVNVKSTVRISSVFVAFLENMNFKRTLLLEKQNSINWVGKKKPTEYTSLKHYSLKFIYSEKPTKFCKISTLLLSYVVPVKSKVEISQNFVAFSEYMNFR